MTPKLFQIVFYGLRALRPGCRVTARLPLAQAVHESANFTSNLYRTNHNFFGMQHPLGRAAAGTTTSQHADARGFAVFKNDLDCLRDYFYWLANFGITDDAQLDNRPVLRPGQRRDVGRIASGGDLRLQHVAHRPDGDPRRNRC